MSVDRVVGWRAFFERGRRRRRDVPGRHVSPTPEDDEGVADGGVERQQDGRRDRANSALRAKEVNSRDTHFLSKTSLVVGGYPTRRGVHAYLDAVAVLHASRHVASYTCVFILRVV